MAVAHGAWNIGTLWNNMWDDLLRPMSKCTMSTSTLGQIEKTIYIYAEMLLHIWHCITTSDVCSPTQPWSNDLWSVASSALTLLRGVITYATSTSSDLFTAPALRDDWGDYLKRLSCDLDTLERYCGVGTTSGKVLSLADSLSGHSAPGREAREDVAACLTQGVDSQGKGGYAGRRREDDVNLVSYALGSHASAADAVVSNQSHKTGGPTGLHISEETAYALRSARSQHGAYGGNNTSGPIDVATACNAHGGTGRCDFESETFIVSASESGQGFWQEDIRALRSHNIQKPEAGVVMASTERTRKDGRNLEAFEDVAYALTNPGQGGRTQSRQILAPCLTQNYDKQPDNSGTGEGPMLIQEGMMVRRLTPRECERLQGLEDDYTLIPYRGKPAKDAPRYRAIGNSFAVPVVRWIAQRIQQVEGLL